MCPGLHCKVGARAGWSLDLQTLWLVSHLLYYIVLSKKKQGKFHAKAQVDICVYVCIDTHIQIVGSKPL